MDQNFATLYFSRKPVDCVVLLDLPQAVYVKFLVWEDLICGIDLNWERQRLKIDPVRIWSGVALLGRGACCGN